MKKFVKITSFILMVLMLVSVFAACKKDPGDEQGGEQNKETVANTNGSSDDGATEVVTVPPIEEKKWGGQEYRILGTESTTDWRHNWEVWREEIPEDKVGISVYNRNQALFEKFEISVKGYLVSGVASAASTALNAGEDLYDLLLLPPESHHPLAKQGYLIDLYTLDYINMEHEGWMPYPNTQLTMGGKLFYTTNKFLVQDKNRSWSVFYNRDMAKELKLGYFEDLVFEGKWTIDKLIEIGKAGTYELDGQPGMGLEDHWGVSAASAYEFGSMVYGAGFRLTEHGSDGYPVLIGATDKMLQILDKCYALRGDSTAFYMDQDHGSINWDYCTDHAFMGGRVCVLFVPISAIDVMKQESDFTIGILPNPKYDEKQEAYHTVPNLGNGSLLSVPSTVINREFAGYGLEAITEESVNTSYITYIEEKSKLQNATDADCAKCMQMIFDGVVYDIGFISDFGGIGTLVRSTLGSTTTNNYARLFSRVEKIASNELKKVKEAYSAMG